jgi:hypothetical protein
MSLYDHDRLINMSTAVIALSSATFFSPDPTAAKSYASTASRLLRAWFLDADTRMNPSLKYGHFIPGVTNGSHGAMIDTHSWGELLDAVTLLRAAAPDAWTDADDSALQSWFKDYLVWLTTSELGIGERNATNNHGCWYDAQVLAVARFVGDHASYDAAAARGPTRVSVEVLPNGTEPAELARTKSWSYSQFALDALFHMATLVSAGSGGGDAAEGGGEQSSLWAYRTSEGASIRGALDWQLQFLGVGAKKWPYPQIEPFESNCTTSMTVQCVSSYYSILKRAATVWPTPTGGPNETYARKALEVLPNSASSSASPYDLLLPS